MAIVAIVQARMGSSRLPGKILLPLCGKPMLWHVIQRLKACTFLDRIVIATSVEKQDDCLYDFCRVNDFDVYRGSENDVLDRYYQAARVFQADEIVRITADCPLIDPEVTASVIKVYQANLRECDGASNVIRRTYPRGLDTEVISFSALQRAWKQAQEPMFREHVTLYLYRHPETFRMRSVESERDISYLRWTVDEEKDFSFVKETYQRLYCSGRIFSMKDILQMLEREPLLMSINSAVEQKKI